MIRLSLFCRNEGLGGPSGLEILGARKDSIERDTKINRPISSFVKTSNL